MFLTRGERADAEPTPGGDGRHQLHRWGDSPGLHQQTGPAGQGVTLFIFIRPTYRRYDGTITFI